MNVHFCPTYNMQMFEVEPINTVGGATLSSVFVSGQATGAGAYPSYLKSNQLELEPEYGVCVDG